MITLIQADSRLWEYLSDSQKQLIQDGEFLANDADKHSDEPTDFSYLVFPIAKTYEGFLKQLFLDLGIIYPRQYYSDNFRIGKALSPNLAKIIKTSAYRQVMNHYGEQLADSLWETWKKGRNLVFHYFPHNYRRLSKEQALDLIHNIISVMKMAVETTNVQPSKDR